MNEFVRAWVARLDDPIAKQAYGALRRGEGRCCLGHACDVAVEMGLVQGRWVENAEKHEGISRRTCDFEVLNDAGGVEQRSHGALPERIRQLLPGHVAIDPRLRMNGVDGDRMLAASSLNDTYKKSLPEIAERVRQTWPKAFE